MQPETQPTPPIAQTPTETIAPQPQSPTPPKKKFPVWLIVVLSAVAGFIVLIVAIVILVTVLAAGPRKVSDEFINNVQANNSTATYALTSDAFQDATSQDELASLVSQVSTYLSGEEKVNGNYVEAKNGTNFAAITYSVENAEGVTVYARVTLVEQEGEWKVQSFRTDDEVLEAIVE